MQATSNMNQTNLIDHIQKLQGNILSKTDLVAYSASTGISYDVIENALKLYKTERGNWNLTLTIDEIQEQVREVTKNPELLLEKAPVRDNLIPEKNPHYVSFGSFSDVKKIISSGLFYPTFITGLSGNGKTHAVEQACAVLKRELIRVNLTIETDEDDLIGGFRLVNGETVWHNGPVIEALKRGAILLLDEIDLASNKIMCLQSILEGNGVFLKKINTFVKPAKGFNIIATANTKGKGSEDGKFIGTNVLNEAFLERFPVTFEQDYPTLKSEINILLKVYKSITDDVDEQFCQHLATWANVIRKTYSDGAIEDLISTRRLIHIIKAYNIFPNKIKAIQVCINRFDKETKDSFMQLYDKIDPNDLTVESVDVKVKSVENLQDNF